jgi:thioredoxin-dependent peroxiredoxin
MLVGNPESTPPVSFVVYFSITSYPIKMNKLFVLFLVACFGMASAFTFGSSPVARNLISRKSSVEMLSVGEVAPDFELKTYDGKSVKLSSFKGKKNVVVFFYPADSTPGCTAEACAFERKAPDFSKKNAVILGVSSGGPADKEKFIKTNKLNNMQLLIDSGDKLRSSWKVPKALFGAFPGRVTYVIDKTGKCTLVYDDLANATGHPEKALNALP